MERNAHIPDWFRRTSMSNHEEQLHNIIRQAPGRLAALAMVRDLGLRQGAIGAGYIRAAVWDHLTGQTGAPVEDIDVIYFDPNDVSRNAERAFEERLFQTLPGAPWSVRNQARMAARNGDAPYASLRDALCHWLETPTCVAAQLSAGGELSTIAPFGLEDLFAMRVRPTPRGRQRADDYRIRVMTKRWQDRWPGVVVEMP